ncbi:MAG: hypothetical protein J1F35_07280 [Erysipelotrichales bacterium]|nr:hypothetical protein [Erysipelotrichales bacterium]
MSKKTIPTRNYLILIGLIVLVICACFAFYNLYNIIEKNKINTSPLANKEVLYNDLKNTTTELDADTFLVISYTQDLDVYNNEKEIKKYLNRINLMNNIMYLNISEYMEDEEFIPDLNKTLKLNDNLKIEKFPALVYYREGIATYSIDSSDHLLNKLDFEQLVDMYELAS